MAKHTVYVAVTVETLDEEHTPCEQVEALFRYGTLRDAFADAGMTILDVAVSDTQSVEVR